MRPHVAIFDYISVSAIYHEFDAENSSASLGDELDAAISAGLRDRYKLTLKAASYDADTFSVDTDKLWLQFDVAFQSSQRFTLSDSRRPLIVRKGG